jgi:hypothetical protein
MAVENSTTKDVATPRTDDHPDLDAPEFHAGRLRALLVSLVCIDDTAQVIEDDEKGDIRSWLTAMARDESRLLLRSLQQETRHEHQ